MKTISYYVVKLHFHELLLLSQTYIIQVVYKYLYQTGNGKKSQGNKSLRAKKYFNDIIVYDSMKFFYNFIIISFYFCLISILYLVAIIL